MSELDRIHLEIVTPDKEVFNGMVERFNIPAVAGKTGILYDHAPLLTALQPGVVEYYQDGELYRIAISKGFMELKNNEAEILVSAGEVASEIDVQRALASLERAKRRLEEKAAGLDVDRARASLMRAMARLTAVQYFPDHGMSTEKGGKE